MKHFTPQEYRKLPLSEINRMIDKDVAFCVSNAFALDNDFSYSIGTKTLLKGNKVIGLTKLETKFLDLLISKDGEIVSIDDIRNIVWNGKNMSIFTMRNIVNKIRNKTYYQIIKNKSTIGYSIYKGKI